MRLCEEPVLSSILDNPIAVREWRVLRRRAGDWRIWVGLKWTLDPIVWGAPVVVTWALAPPALQAALSALRRSHLIVSGTLLFDPMQAVALVYWVYVVVISWVLGVTAAAGEWRQQIWDQIYVTPLSGRERVLGLFWGRLAPIWAGLLITAVFWWLLQPSYGVLVKSLGAPEIPRRRLMGGMAWTACTSLLASEIGLLGSLRWRRTSELSRPIELLWGWLMLFIAMLFMVFGPVDGSAPPNGAWDIGFLAYVVLSTCLGFEQSLEVALREP